MFTIVETRKVVNCWYYEVEADSLNEAMEMVENGEVEPDDLITEDDHYDSEFECINQYTK